jgi:hypothetical protein
MTDCLFFQCRLLFTSSLDRWRKKMLRFLIKKTPLLERKKVRFRRMAKIVVHDFS